jgi:hypothetical protein
MVATYAGPIQLMPVALGGILARRARQSYTAVEQQFSVIVQRRLHQLLEGDRNELLIMRLYPDQPERLGVMGTPPSLDRASLRIPVVQPMLEDVVQFLAAGLPGGPTCQQKLTGGRVLERQSFPTRYPHVVIEREDLFAANGQCVQSTITAVRVQNQRAQTRTNRLLDLANLGFELGSALLAG